MKSKLLERVNYVGQNLWKTRWWNFLFWMDEKVVLTCCVFEGVCPRRWAGELLQGVWCWNPTFRLRRERWQIRRQGHSNTSLWLSTFICRRTRKRPCVILVVLHYRMIERVCFFESEPSGIEISPCLTAILLEVSRCNLRGMKQIWSVSSQWQCVLLKCMTFLTNLRQGPIFRFNPKNCYSSGTDGRWQSQASLLFL